MSENFIALTERPNAQKGLYYKSHIKNIDYVFFSAGLKKSRRVAEEFLKVFIGLAKVDKSKYLDYDKAYKNSIDSFFNRIEVGVLSIDECGGCSFKADNYGGGSQDCIILYFTKTGIYEYQTKFDISKKSYDINVRIADDEIYAGSASTVFCNCSKLKHYSINEILKRIKEIEKICKTQKIKMRNFANVKKTLKENSETYEFQYAEFLADYADLADSLKPYVDKKTLNDEEFQAFRKIEGLKNCYYNGYENDYVLSDIRSIACDAEKLLSDLRRGDRNYSMVAL